MVISLEEYSRRMNLEVHITPENISEYLNYFVEFLAERLGLKDSAVEHIEAVLRVKCKEGLVPPILYIFSSLHTLDNSMKERMALRT